MAKKKYYCTSSFDAITDLVEFWPASDNPREVYFEAHRILNERLQQEYKDTARDDGVIADTRIAKIAIYEIPVADMTRINPLEHLKEGCDPEDYLEYDEVGAFKEPEPACRDGITIHDWIDISDDGRISQCRNCKMYSRIVYETYHNDTGDRIDDERTVGPSKRKRLEIVQWFRKENQ